MAVTRRTLHRLRKLLTTIGAETDDTVRQLTQAWVKAWDELNTSWRIALTELVATAAKTGIWPAPWQLARIERLAAAATATEARLVELSTVAATLTTAGAGTVVAATAAAEPGIIASQLPAGIAVAIQAELAANLLPSVLDLIVARTAEQITSLTRPLSQDATEAMRRALVKGVAAGDNPITAARDMVARVEGAFNGGLTRAIVIARTEMLGVYREASRYTHQANAAYLAGWQWNSSLDRRACAACWAMHGTIFPVTAPGPDDHQQGRCGRLPVAKPWQELGLPDIEPDSVSTVDAETRWRALPREQQNAMFGQRRAAMLRDRSITWTDLAVRRDNPHWRPSYIPRTVRDLERIAAIRRTT